MNNLFLDIETVPIKIIHEDVKEYLMDKKITKASRGMNPSYAKIILICTKYNGELKSFEGDEKEILQEFWDYLREKRPTKIVTYNGYKFDIPFILVRSAINKIKPTFQINTNKWNMNSSNHFDVMLFFSHNETFINPNLEVIGKMHGIEISGERVEGHEIEKLYLKGNFDKIKEKCIQDTELLERVFEKFFVNL